MKPNPSTLFALITVLTLTIFATSQAASSAADNVKGTNDQSPATQPQTSTVLKNNPKP